MKKDGKEFRTVAKFFVWGDAEREWEILNRAHEAGLNLPAPLHIYENIIFMEFIPGKSLKMMADRGETLPVELLAQWLAKFHLAFRDGKETLLKGDGMFPNFLFREDNQQLFGVDFEESVPGREITDVADMMTSLLMTGNSFGENNVERTRIFLASYTKCSPVSFREQELRDLIFEGLNRRISYVPEIEQEIRSFMDKMKQIRF